MEQPEIRLYDRFKSIAVMAEPNLDGDDFQIGSVALVAWITQYDEWYKQFTGIHEGLRPYSLYGRDVSLFGPELLSLPEPVRNVAAAAQQLGIGFSITVDVLHLYRDFAFIQTLCQDHLLGSLGIVLDRVDTLAEHILPAAFIDQVAALGCPIGLIGSVKLLRKHQLLTLASLNGMNITMYPTPDQESIDHFVVPANPIKSCANRLRLYIDTDGYIFPCSGLLGLTDYAIGHIRDDVHETFPARATSKLDLVHLIREGPQLSGDIVLQQRMTNLPWVCEQHRMELIAND